MDCPRCEKKMAVEAVSPIEVITMYFGADIYNPIMKHYCATRDNKGFPCGYAVLEYERA